MRIEGKRTRFGRTTEVDEKHGEKLDMSGMSLDSVPNPSINLGLVTKLDLSNNNLESIPESLTARLLNMVVLDVHSNQLKSLPNSIGCLSKLKVLDVSGNLLESFPKTFENCRALEELYANFNKLTKLPDTIGFELINIRRLSVNSNKLSELPFSTSHLTALRSLDARLNCLTSLPDGLENLTALETLNVSQNFRYLRTLPFAVGLLGSLKEMDISYNYIKELPPSIGCLTKLEKLNAEGNPLINPPRDVMEQSIPVIREYLAARINETGNESKTKGSSWFGRLVKCTTFNSRMAPNNPRIRHSYDGLLKSHYRSIDGLTSPRHFGLGMLSPHRLFFSPKRDSPRKSASL
ncbi:Plant intracellular ras-group-related LRR protein [Rhynchospora pubera]|nr:Plant intracellular ras-group-related LRR protein [Rhynchospora pubera]